MGIDFEGIDSSEFEHDSKYKYYTYTGLPHYHTLAQNIWIHKEDSNLGYISCQRELDVSMIDIVDFLGSIQEFCEDALEITVDNEYDGECVNVFLQGYRRATPQQLQDWRDFKKAVEEKEAEKESLKIENAKKVLVEAGLWKEE